MSFVVTAPPVLASAASDLGGIASMISEANAMAAVRTTALAPAAADEVSAAIAALFSSYARDYQTLSVQVTAFHVQFAQTLTNAGQLYAVVDVGNGVLLKTEQQVLGVINAPTQTLVGRPLIGDGTHGAPGAAVAPQDAAVPAGLSHRTTGPVGAVADQRTPQQRLGGRVHRVQQVLLRVGNLGARI